jgi:aminoglycoside/choline kinase family phosphotransferase
MEQSELEQARRDRYLRAARNLGFPERQARYLAFWRWLARQRGETKERWEVPGLPG